MCIPHRCSCSDSSFQVEVRYSEDEGTVPGGSRPCRSHTYTPHTHSQGWETPLHPQTHDFQRSSLAKMQTLRKQLKKNICFDL